MPDLRDHFAAIAMRALLERETAKMGTVQVPLADVTIAQWAYQLADAMLSARKEAEQHG